MSISAILLADFLSEGASPALYPFDDERTLIEWQVDALMEAGVRDIEVVLGPGADRIVPLVSRDGVEPIVNPRWQTDAASGIRVGTSAVPRGTEFALMLRVDQPRPAAICARLLDEAPGSGPDLTRPTADGRAGTPVVVNGRAIEALRNLRERTELNDLASRFTARDVPFESKLVTESIASAEALRELRERYGF